MHGSTHENNDQAQRCTLGHAHTVLRRCNGFVDEKYKLKVLLDGSE